MNAFAASVNTIPAPLPFAPGYTLAGATVPGIRSANGGAISIPSRQSSAAPKLIRSVVEEAGLGRFVYLQGKSGRRYVFSSISREQVALYDHALFAATEPGGASVRIGKTLHDLKGCGQLLYVHLLDTGSDDCDAALCDLEAVVA